MLTVCSKVSVNYRLPKKYKEWGCIKLSPEGVLYASCKNATLSKYPEVQDSFCVVWTIHSLEECPLREEAGPAKSLVHLGMVEEFNVCDRWLEERKVETMDNPKIVYYGIDDQVKRNKYLIIVNKQPDGQYLVRAVSSGINTEYSLLKGRGSSLQGTIDRLIDGLHDSGNVCGKFVTIESSDVSDIPFVVDGKEDLGQFITIREKGTGYIITMPLERYNRLYYKGAEEVK